MIPTIQAELLLYDSTKTVTVQVDPIQYREIIMIPGRICGYEPLDCYSSIHEPLVLKEKGHSGLPKAGNFHALPFYEANQLVFNLIVKYKRGKRSRYLVQPFGFELGEIETVQLIDFG